MEIGLTTSTMNDKEEITPNWFEQAIDDYDYERPKRCQFVEGIILRIDDDAILVDIGVKRDAIVPSWDLNLLPKDFLAGLSTGSDVLVCIMRPPEGDQDLLVSLNKGLEYKSWERAETYRENGLTFEVEIIGEIGAVYWLILRGCGPLSPTLRLLNCAGAIASGLVS